MVSGRLRGFLVANFIKPFERNFVVLTLILFVSTYVLNIREVDMAVAFDGEKGTDLLRCK